MYFLLEMWVHHSGQTSVENREEPIKIYGTGAFVFSKWTGSYLMQSKLNSEYNLIKSIHGHWTTTVSCFIQYSPPLLSKEITAASFNLRPGSVLYHCVTSLVYETWSDLVLGFVGGFFFGFVWLVLLFYFFLLLLIENTSRVPHLHMELVK